MGRLRMVWGLGTLIGIFLYNNFLKNVGFKKMMICSSLGSSIIGLAGILMVTRMNEKIGAPDSIFAISSSFLN